VHARNAQSPGSRERLAWSTAASLVVLLAVLLRLRGWENWSFWLDEAMQLDYVRRGFSDMWRAVVRDRVHPPLEYVLSWLWYRLSPAEAWLRTLPVLWSAGTVVALLVRCGGRSAPVRSLAAAGAFATFPLAVVLGNEFRPYALALFLVASFDASRVRHLSTGSRESLAATIAFGVLACWTLYWAGVFVAVALGLDILERTRGRDRDAARRFVLALGATVALSLPWIVLVARVHVPGRAPSAPRPSVELLLRFVGGLLADRQEDVKQPIVAAGIGLLVLAGVVVGRRGERLRVSLELILLSGGVLGALSLTGHWWAVRYLALALLPASRAIGFAVERGVPGRWSGSGAAVAAVGALLLVQSGALSDAARWARPDWRRPADYLAFAGRSGERGPVAAADSWAWFALRAQLEGATPPSPVALKPSVADLEAWMRDAGEGWIVRAPRFGAPGDLDRLLSERVPWARFPDADDVLVYRVESGRLVSP
jgi:hypothetical protein